MTPEEVGVRTIVIEKYHIGVMFEMQLWTNQYFCPHSRLNDPKFECFM